MTKLELFTVKYTDFTNIGYNSTDLYLLGPDKIYNVGFGYITNECPELFLIQNNLYNSRIIIQLTTNPKLQIDRSSGYTLITPE